MEPESTQIDDARRLYDRLSHAYDRLAEASEHGVRDLGLQALPVACGASVLEVGCGTGHGLANLSRRVGHPGSVCGLDVSAGMLDVARAHLVSAGTGQGLLVRGDARRLCFAAQVFDAVFMSSTLELFGAGIPDVLAEAWRVLRPGGRIGIVAMADTGHPNAMTRFYEWVHQHWPQVVDCRPIDVVGVARAAGFSVDAVASASVWALPVAIAIGTKWGGAPSPRSQ